MVKVADLTMMLVWLGSSLHQMNEEERGAFFRLGSEVANPSTVDSGSVTVRVIPPKGETTIYNKIVCIKACRNTTGYGLKEAKDLIDFENVFDIKLSDLRGFIREIHSGGARVEIV